MKKIVFAVGVCSCLLFCGNQIYSKTRPVSYELHMDSSGHHTYEVKKEIQTTFEDIVQGLNLQSQKTMVIYNIEQFKTKEITKVEWKDKLILYQGDGKGSVLEGELVQSEYCLDTVKPKSFLQELFGA